MRRLIFTLLILVAISLGACRTTLPAPTKQLQAHFVYENQGDAILIDCGTVEVLIDGGDEWAGANLVRYLTRYVDDDLEAIVATNPYSDHVGGLMEVLRTFQVDSIYWNGETSDTKTYSDFMALAQAEPSALVRQVKRGDRINVDSVSFDVLSPPGIIFDNAADNSLVLRLKYGEVSFLFTSDARKEAEANILAAHLNVDTEILQVGDHGSRLSSSVDWLKAVSPQIAICMVGATEFLTPTPPPDIIYDHPDRETITALNNVGAKVYNTLENGTIIVSSDGKGYTLKMEYDKKAPPPTPPTLSPTSAQPPVNPGTV